ncbi:MAG: hypothetical protein J6S77_06075 [Clostridia bacterium]|nr:hypothetical protein [Clostridia bacterium]
MNELIYVLIFFALFVTALVLILIPTFKNAKACNGVENTDTFTRYFCFLLNISPEEALETLSVKSEQDEMSYTLLKETRIIIFLDGAASVDYDISFYKHEEKYYMCVRQIPNVIIKRTFIPLVINPFFVKKLNAVPFAYNRFLTIKDIAESV